MLRFLSIRRLAVIDALQVEFGPGFNVLTGETGAGKSILVEAGGLLLGGRASGDLVRTAKTWPWSRPSSRAVGTKSWSAERSPRRDAAGRSSTENSAPSRR